MKLSDFNYEYPKELIAQRPLPQRDASRMMIVDRKAENFAHANFLDLPNYLREGDLVIFNDSKVVPARIFGKRGTGEDLEVLVVEPAAGGSGKWRCLLKKAKRIRTGEKIFFGMQSTATACGREDIFLILDFKSKGLELAIKHHGVPPLPPYIEREGFAAYTDEDRERYQTVFASAAGSAAAPTAGLHFSEQMIERIGQAGAKIAHVTLHVGIDTFAPVRADELTGHKMHGERFEISDETAREVAEAKRAGRRVIAVGTTATRALESAALVEEAMSYAWKDGHLAPGRRSTDLFITPGFRFQVVDALLTNFHQPKSTLLVLVSAFTRREFILSCYEEAIRQKYRLFSYGDCMLIV